MKLTLRFVVPLAFLLALVAYGVLPLVDTLTLRWFVRDLDIRSQLISSTMQEPLGEMLSSRSEARIKNYFDRAIQDERLYAIAVCDMQNKFVYKTSTFPAVLSCSSVSLQDPLRSQHVKLQQVALHVVALPLEYMGASQGKLVLIHDMSFIEKRSDYTRRYVFYFFIVLALLTSFITVLIARLTNRGLINGVRLLLRGEGLRKFSSSDKSPELRPIAKDIRELVRDLERERRSKDEGQMNWNAKSLKTILNRDLAGDEVLIVSNREPYIHIKRDHKIDIQMPASGLVTALEPIMRACSGTWIAHGSGSADREVVDKHDHVKVPPDDPSYQIRRVWLTPEEELGYYYGFSNEGLWPLCHIAHTRPTFRTSDWKQYVEVNRKFAKAVIEEAKTDDPVILVQDYHFALLPQLIRDSLPNATIITFWHIPWPNPESFGICPWREEIITGLLGSSIIGFHTQFHCNNFVETVDRFLEARIDRENSTISYGGKMTAVKNYPISIEWPPRWLLKQKSIAECRSHIREINGIAPDCKIGGGVDRLDYTKGILERFVAVERLFELHPEFIGKFTFVQIAAPSRSTIEQYRFFNEQVHATAERINLKFGKGSYRPICLKIEHHEPNQVFEYYRGSDVCMVTSLHDGMNLVAKEFVAARDDEQGALILSQFAGASRELPESLIVNPYNADQCAAALNIALTMPAVEQRDRMRSMRALIQEFNVFRWAGRMLIDAARMRQRQRLMGKIRDSESTLREGWL